MSSSVPKNAAIPSTWEVRWLDDVIENISSSETQTTTLRITVPSNEGPGFTEFDCMQPRFLVTFRFTQRW